MSHSIATYLGQENKEKRLQLLAAMQAGQETLAPDLSADLLCLPLDLDEQIAILHASCGSDPLTFEHLVTQGYRSWPQDLCTFALRKWSLVTEHLLGYRFLASLAAPHTSQRLKFTLLDLNFYLPGHEVLELLCASPGLEELSPAFHALLFQRSLQWRFFAARLESLALALMTQTLAGKRLDARLLAVLLPWLAVRKPELLAELSTHSDGFEVWKDHAKVLLRSPRLGKKAETELQKLSTTPKAGAFWPSFLALWPPLWERHSLSVPVLSLALQGCLRRREEFGANRPKVWELFSGIEPKVLVASLLALEDSSELAAGVRLLDGLLPWVLPDPLSLRLRAQGKKAEDLAGFLAALPLRRRIALQELEEAASKASRFSQVSREEKAFRATQFRVSLPLSDLTLPALNPAARERLRQQFFSLAYRGEEVSLAAPVAGEFWSLLSQHWLKPQEAELPALASLARQQPFLFHSVYVRTLARFKGSDLAVLKLLDFIRTRDSQLLGEVIGALGAIGTPRALQELLACLTRPNMTLALQLEAAHLLKGKDLSSLQAELRSVIEILSPKVSSVTGLGELTEALQALLLPQNPVLFPSAGAGAGAGAGRDAVSALQGEGLDQLLRGRISQLDQLSMEVRRALRTAQFFSQQVGLGENAHVIDLSPVIDMQYKALELLFREEFEEACNKFINLGSLQRKLDVLGYSRPIIHAMDDFERYISLLPVIRDIPYFSKFKLRKMLRALCQFRPGKRFTLDGLKAFSLFFLCFGRKKCSFGLDNLLSLGFSSDEDLFYFCKQLHIFQDFRNRAAHEGFRPEAREDIEGIWQHTATIIAAVSRVKMSLQEQLHNL